MRLGYRDYIKLVTEEYHKKRANNKLSPLLAQSTPASLRKECWNVYTERYDKKDEPVLRAFFGPAEPGKQFLQLIRDFSTDKFKPLDNYLKGKALNTDDKNLGLLAWLIDFEHRPFVTGMNVILNDEEIATIGKSEKNEEIKGETTFTKSKGKPMLRTLTIFLIALVSLGVGYFVWEQTTNAEIGLDNETSGCMYWASDHYEMISCKEERKDRLKLPLDVERMKIFKKIMKEDTITERSIGRVHYIKIDGRIEYYTAGGNHPVDVTRNLRPLSPYMFDKYLRGLENAQKVSQPN